MSAPIHTVFDACLVAKANGRLVGRRRGNVLDHRLRVLEEFVISRTRLARYNQRMLKEYEDHLKDHRNDVIQLFFRCLAEQGTKVSANNLSRQAFDKARRARWPTHDQHLLAAAIGVAPSCIATTEENLGLCDAAVRKAFDVYVECL